MAQNDQKEFIINVEKVYETIPPRGDLDDTRDYLLQYLDKFKTQCQQKRDAYSIFASKLRHRHNLISIPLLILTSATGVLPAVGAGEIPSVIVGAASAVITAIQRYCAYSERAENARLVAKGFGKVVRTIENDLMTVYSNATTIDSTVFTSHVQQIQRDIDAVHESATDIPWELLKTIDTIDAHVWCVPVQGARTGVRHQITTEFA